MKIYIALKVKPVNGERYVGKFDDKHIETNKHITLIYDNETEFSINDFYKIDFCLKWSLINNSIFGSYLVTDSKPYAFGQTNNYIVERVSSPKLVKLHNELIKTFGFKHSYKEYSPHITLIKELDYDATDFCNSLIDEIFEYEIVDYVVEELVD